MGVTASHIIEYRRLAAILKAWGPAAAWAAVLFLLSAFSELPYRAASLGMPDKVVHFGVYSLLGAALAHAKYHGAHGTPHLVMLLIGAAYGATDEWHQSFVPRRDASFGDWLADVAGVSVGYAVAWLLAMELLRRGWMKPNPVADASGPKGRRGLGDD